MRLLDVRCDGTRQSGPQRGMVCNYLLLRRFPTLDGSIETKCPRCNKVRLWSYGLVSVST
jgi:hypothetical protein